MEKATFAAGCFWGVEERFRRVPGVVSTAAGYTGGHWANPCYLDVCARITGHAESVLIEYDRSQISYQTLLEIFWNCHDPTQVNRQGRDRGEQYRSVIFYHNSEQEKAARESKQKLQTSGKYDNNIATEIKPAGEFYMAEDYHQQYLEKKVRQRMSVMDLTDIRQRMSVTDLTDVGQRMSVTDLTDLMKKEEGRKIFDISKIIHFDYAQCPIPNAIKPNSQFPIPNSQFPFPIPKIYAQVIHWQTAGGTFNNTHR